MYTHTNSKF